MRIEESLYVKHCIQFYSKTQFKVSALYSSVSLGCCQPYVPFFPFLHKEPSSFGSSITLRSLLVLKENVEVKVGCTQYSWGSWLGFILFLPHHPFKSPSHSLIICADLGGLFTCWCDPSLHFWEIWAHGIHILLKSGFLHFFIHL